MAAHGQRGPFARSANCRCRHRVRPVKFLHRSWPEVVVLQMANADVNDETLMFLRGMNQLRELDLNGTQVTDAGLPLLAALPQLKELRLARTKISDEGFRQYVASREALTKLDLTG